MRHLRIMFIAIVGCAAVTGCIPTGDEHVNTELFKDRAEVSTRTSAIKPGMSKKAVFERLKISADRFDRMSTEQVQMAIYGNSQVRGSPAQLEAFRKKLSHYEGYSLPYRNIKSNGTMGFGTMRITKTGSDLRIVLIFNGDHLLRATVEGTPVMKQVDDQNMVPSLLGRALGFIHL